jgi:hypothetical protein
MSRHWPPFWARCIHSTSSHHFSCRSILILFSHPRLIYTRGLFLQVPLLKCFMLFWFLPCVLCPVHVFPWFDYPNNIWWSLPPLPPSKVQIFFSASCSQTLTNFIPVLVWVQVSHPYKTTGKNMVLCIYSRRFWGGDGKINDSKLDGSKHSANLIFS